MEQVNWWEQRKECKNCKEEKGALDFTPRLNICKKCNRERAKKRQAKLTPFQNMYFRSGAKKLPKLGEGWDLHRITPRKPKEKEIEV